MRQMRRYECKQPEASFAQECTSLSDLQGPQRQRSVHRDNQFPAEQKKKTRGGEKRKQLADKIKNCVVFFPTPSQNDTRQNHNGSSCHGIKLNYVYSCGGANFRAHSWRSARNFLREIFSAKEKFKAWHFFLVVVRVIIFHFFFGKTTPWS